MRHATCDTDAQGLLSDVTVEGFNSEDDMLISNFCFSDVTKPQHLNSYGGFKFIDTSRHSSSVFKHDYEVACRMSHGAWCTLHVARCMLHVARRMSAGLRLHGLGAPGELLRPQRHDHRPL